MKKLKALYDGVRTKRGRVIAEALELHLAGKALPEPLTVALRNLELAYQDKRALPDVQTAEKYVVEAWEEYVRSAP